MTIGNFDGVHLGHQQIVARLRCLADQLGGPAVVFTFDPPPLQLLRPERKVARLTWPQRKAELLEQMGVDGLVSYPTDRLLLELSPEKFFRRILLEGLAARAVVEGTNFRFGKARGGDVRMLQQLGQPHEMAVAIVPPVLVDGEVVSSSGIRHRLESGQVRAARDRLGRPHRLRGHVVRGERRGSRLGFPTANLERLQAVSPGHGVYAARAWADARPVAAAVHVGPNPTFGQQQPKVEVHLIDFAGDLYGQPLEVDFLQRLRDIHTFPTVEQLVAQLRRDVQAARAHVDLSG